MNARYTMCYSASLSVSLPLSISLPPPPSLRLPPSLSLPPSLPPYLNTGMVPDKPNHSVETALVCVQNYSLHAVDNQDVVIVVFLDLSAALDTLDHNLMLQRLSRCKA